jgi:hypothetical protein
VHYFTLVGGSGGLFSLHPYPELTSSLIGIYRKHRIHGCMVLGGGERALVGQHRGRSAAPELELFNKV